MQNWCRSGGEVGDCESSAWGCRRGLVSKEGVKRLRIRYQGAAAFCNTRARLCIRLHDFVAHQEKCLSSAWKACMMLTDFRIARLPLSLRHDSPPSSTHTAHRFASRCEDAGSGTEVQAIKTWRAARLGDKAGQKGSQGRPRRRGQAHTCPHPSSTQAGSPPGAQQHPAAERHREWDAQRHCGNPNCSVVDMKRGKRG